MLALAFDPWPLWLAQWERPDVRGAPLVSVSQSRVVHLSPAARRAGVVRGMALTGAAAKVERLEVVGAQTPNLKSAWEGLLSELYGYTSRLEPLSQGRLLMGLEPVEARQVAGSYFARGGLADTAEHALLGALTAAEGQVREASASFCAQVPVYVLRGLGVS
jgi:nucleotidyltransferase/DNA polymerase involved in DNA repair